MPCPRWSSTATTRRQRRTALGYPEVQLPGMRPSLPRADRPAVQRSPGPDGYRPARRVGASPVHAPLPRRRRALAPARRRSHARDDPELGVPLRAALGGPAPGQAPRPRRGRLVHRRDLREGRGPLVLPGSGHRSRWGTPRFEAEGAARHACRPALPAAPGGRGRAQARACHDGPASALPPSDPLDPGENGAAPMQSIPEHPHRAKPAGHQAAR